jgi:tRNA-Thr(GGU) m(6)t(6)A37 methyltransferase TsaA
MRRDGRVRALIWAARRNDVAMRLEIEPVGYVSSSRVDANDDQWDAEQSSIQLVPEFSRDSIAGLGEFSHIEVLYYFHKVDASSVVKGARHPRGNVAWPMTGIFAQRGRNRPNRLGSTTCRLLRVDGTTLHVTGLDAIEGTPVLDIKPVMNEFLPRGTVVQPDWSHELMKGYWGEESRT